MSGVDIEGIEVAAEPASKPWAAIGFTCIGLAFIAFLVVPLFLALTSQSAEPTCPEGKTPLTHSACAR